MGCQQGLHRAERDIPSRGLLQISGTLLRWLCQRPPEKLTWRGWDRPLDNDFLISIHGTTILCDIRAKFSHKQHKYFQTPGELSFPVSSQPSQARA